MVLETNIRILLKSALRGKYADNDWAIEGGPVTFRNMSMAGKLYYFTMFQMKQFIFTGGTRNIKLYILFCRYKILL